MYNFQSRKGAHLLSIWLKPTDGYSRPEGKETLRSVAPYKRHQFAHSKRWPYLEQGGRGQDRTDALGVSRG